MERRQREKEGREGGGGEGGKEGGGGEGGKEVGVRVGRRWG